RQAAIDEIDRSQPHTCMAGAIDIDPHPQYTFVVATNQEEVIIGCSGTHAVCATCSARCCSASMTICIAAQATSSWLSSGWRVVRRCSHMPGVSTNLARPPNLGLTVSL